MTEHEIHSVLGIGFGPANLSLAVTLEELGYTGRSRFVERAADFQWQDEQLIDGADIQNNPFRDLTMPRNTGSAYTFVNYLASQGRLTDYLHLNAKFPLRREYAGYLRWVADSFRDAVDYGRSATRLTVADTADGEVFRLETDDGREYLGETVVIGTGRSPRIPPVFRRSLGPTVFHATRYLSSLRRLRGRALRVAVVGGSQSAIEIVLDLLGRDDVAQVVSVQRGIGFRLKDTSPYSRRVFLPEFIDYFYPLPAETKRRIRAELRSINYAACDQDVIDRLATVQHEYALKGSDRLRLMPFSEVSEVAPHGSGGVHRLVVRDVNNDTRSVYDADVVVLATGFRDFGLGPDDEPYHPLLADVADRLALTEEGIPAVARDYSVPVARRAYGSRPLRLYLNGLCEASHGMGDAGALAVLSARSTDIAESLMPEPEGVLGPDGVLGSDRALQPDRTPDRVLGSGALVPDHGIGDIGDLGDLVVDEALR
ncbi:SidA/IucD/PvdA family monooxygenase [Streptomyces mobaraensis]|uniref:L-lysine N6-monooxygenase MbtG n=1 Tax=Streptomyces mobaraensis TaxID=35621 RepID=A0A5N5VWL8_STRMB|nr:SidA/IucD/PvdA family monooxygenase [Streptomyces mobaraensis]KAB7832662.1 oxidoreductase [Streptomyces mobaraensis]